LVLFFKKEQSFFFEKKKQKTFIRFGFEAAPQRGAAGRTRVRGGDAGRRSLASLLRLGVEWGSLSK
jgi:hypothetical protein